MKHKSTELKFRKREIDIRIDELTKCLVRRSSGEEVRTVYRQVKDAITPKLAVEYFGWMITQSIDERVD